MLAEIHLQHSWATKKKVITKVGENLKFLSCTEYYDDAEIHLQHSWATKKKVITKVGENLKFLSCTEYYDEDWGVL